MKRLAIILSVAATICPFAQAQYQTQAPADSGNPMPEFRSNVVSRSTPAVSYRHRSGSTKIDFQGTDLMHGAMGQAKVASKRGALSIDAEFSGLDRPTSLGHEYLTYVLWAISPEGRPVNIGEVLVGDNHRSKLYVTTDLQAFAMIVTAEPYYAVRRPSNLVILENVVRPDTRGSTESVSAKYEMIDRGGYLPTGYKFDPVVLNAGLPLEFFEARNAIRIAQSAGAEQYATDSYRKAVRQMDEADSMATRKHENKKSLIAVSREVVEKAEDAREISVKHIDEERLAHERRAGANREASANDRADAESQRRADAETETAEAQRRRREAQAPSASQPRRAGQARRQALERHAVRAHRHGDAERGSTWGRPARVRQAHHAQEDRRGEGPPAPQEALGLCSLAGSAANSACRPPPDPAEQDGSAPHPRRRSKEAPRPPPLEVSPACADATQKTHLSPPARVSLIRPRVRPEVGVERAVLLHNHDDVLDLRATLPALHLDDDRLDV